MACEKNEYFLEKDIASCHFPAEQSNATSFSVQ